MSNSTYDVSVRREQFMAQDSWVARDTDGHWRAYCAAHFAADAQEAVAAMFHACEVGRVWTDGAETKANILS